MSEHWVTDPAVPIKVKIAEKGFGAIPPRTVAQQFKSTVAKHGDRKAMAVKETGKVPFIMIILRILIYFYCLTL